LLGTGTYGCVFGSSAEPEVRKLATKRGLDREIPAGLALSKLDPTNQYGVYIDKSECGVLSAAEKASIQRDARVSKNAEASTCLQLVDSREACLVRMPKYDYSLESKIPILGRNLAPLLNLWRGLAFYHQNGWTHQDIKLPNIGFLGNRLIFADFGLSVHLKTDCGKLKSEYERLRRLNVPQYPPWSSYVLGPVDHSGGSCEAIQTLLKYNDVHGLAMITLDILDARLWPDLAKYMQAVIDNQSVLTMASTVVAQMESFMARQAVVPRRKASPARSGRRKIYRSRGSYRKGSKKKAPARRRR
jgi:serine/threonine protein kinase